MNTKEQIELMKKYLLVKFKNEDWHGVTDAAADLRELVVRLSFEPKVIICSLKSPID